MDLMLNVMVRGMCYVIYDRNVQQGRDRNEVQIWNGKMDRHEIGERDGAVDEHRETWCKA